MKAIIIPGNENSDISENWYPYVKKELERLGVEVIAQNMPDAYLARAKYWLPFIKEKLDTEHKEQVNYDAWEHASPQETGHLVSLHTKYFKVLDIDPNNHEATKKMMSPDEFEKTWNSTKSREILDNFALKVTHSKISIENWKKLVVEANDANNAFEIKGNKLRFTEGQFKSRSIDEWSNSKIEELLKPDPREKVWAEYAGNNEKEGDKKEGIFADDFDAKFFMEHKDVLFAEPDNPDSTKLKPFWNSLFNLPAKFYKDGKLSANDFEAISRAIKDGKLDNDFDEEIDPDSSWNIPFMGKDNDYWTMDNGKLVEIDDGVNENTGKEVSELADSFAVDLNGNNSMLDENFSSVKALVERLKQNF